MSGDLRNGVADPEDDRVHHAGDVQSGLKRCGCGSARDGREHPGKELHANEHQLIVDNGPLSDRKIFKGQSAALRSRSGQANRSFDACTKAPSGERRRHHIERRTKA